jgi:hypothetical protein
VIVADGRHVRYREALEGFEKTIRGGGLPEPLCRE